MTVPTQENQENTTQNNKELNFRKLEQALEAKYEKQLSQERNARLEAEKLVQEAQQRKSHDDDDDSTDPYIDQKKLERKLEKFGAKAKLETKNEIHEAVKQALHEERKQNWIKSNPDFYDILQHAERLAITNPELAESILDMPEGFERQKLAYKSIKALAIHKPPEEKKSSIQDKIDANRRSPYYQPSGVGTAPYASVSDFSSGGQEQAYKKMQELKKNLRLG